MDLIDVVRDPLVVWWSRLLLASYRRLTGRDLGAIAPHTDPPTQARSLFEAPIVVLSHATGSDPILNYGNRAALARWDVSWAEFVSTPSSATTDGDGRAQRQAAFAQVRRDGLVEGYRGTRIDRHGNRFEIIDVTIWEVRTDDGLHVGDAAAFARSITI